MSNKNVLLILTLRSFSVVVFLLMTTLTTNSMEIVPSKKLDKTKNIIDNHNFSTDKNIKQPRPTINVNLYINNGDYKAHYAGSDYYKKMNTAGIASSIQNQQKMPLISIAVIDADRRNWINHVPEALIDYKLKKELTIEETKKMFRKIAKKIFPHAIPADILYEHKTGDLINLMVHGFPVIATCSSDPRTNEPFEKDFICHINNFSQKPTYFFSLMPNELYLSDVKQELKEANLINDNGGHGIDRFISIDKLLLEDKNIPNIFLYLQQREFGQKVLKISSHTEKFPLIARDAFLPQ